MSTEAECVNEPLRLVPEQKAAAAAPARAGRSRAWARSAATAVALGTAALTLVAFFGRHEYLELATHFRLQYALAASLCAAALLAARAWPAAALAACCAAVNWAYIAPFYAAAPPAPAAAAGAPVRLLLSNVYYKNRDVPELIATVEREKPDVVMLVEVTENVWNQLVPLADQYPYWRSRPRAGGSGLVLLSRLPIDSADVVTFGTPDQPGLFARLEVGGADLSLLALHPPTPIRARKFAYRNRQFEGAAALMRETPGPKVLVGDLNTTPWSPYFQDLVAASGLRDVRVGSGLWTTWPMPLPAFLRIPIDHCLTSDDVTVRGFTTVGETGSDHRALIVDVSVAGGASVAAAPHPAAPRAGL